MLDKAMDAVASIVDSVNPIRFAEDQFNLGQARDEARAVRAGDIERQESWLQRQFDQAERFGSLNWRVKDAKSAGLSASAAIGGGGSPMSGGYSPVGMNAPTVSGSGAGGMSASERRIARLNEELLSEQVKAQKIENLRNFNSLKQPKTGLPEAGNNLMPGGSQIKRRNDKAVVDVPLERTMAIAGGGQQEAGVISDYGYTQTENGLAIRPSTQQKQAMEDDLISELAWHFRNRIRQPRYPKEYDPGPGYYWEWKPFYGEWRKKKMRGPTTKTEKWLQSIGF